MRRFSLGLVLSSAVMLLAVACSSDPAAPTVDDGSGPEGGGSAGSSGSAGSTAGSAGAGAEGGSSVGGSGGSGGSDTGGTGGTANNTDYPAGPYGYQEGDTVTAYTFQGVVDPSTIASQSATAGMMKTISLAEYYNPDGDTSKPRFMLVTASARWCPVCQEEAQDMQEKWAQWNPQGVEFLTTIFEDDQYNPATSVDLYKWAHTYDLHYPVAIDPQLKLGPFFDQSAAPFNMVIDLRTMKIRYGKTGAFFFGGGPGDGFLAELVAE